MTVSKSKYNETMYNYTHALKLFNKSFAVEFSQLAVLLCTIKK